MTTFENKYTVSFEEVLNLLNLIHKTFSTEGVNNTYQLNRIASDGMGNAIFSALSRTYSTAGFQTELIKQCRAMQGIAKTFNFTLDDTYNVNKRHDDHFKNGASTVEKHMFNIMFRNHNLYGVTDKVERKTFNDVLVEMDYADITEDDILKSDFKYNKDITEFMHANKSIVKSQFPDAKFDDIKGLVTEYLFPKPEPIKAFDRLTIDATEVHDKAVKLTTDTWELVKTVFTIKYPDADINAFQGTDGFTGVDRFKFVEMIQRNFEWMLKNNNEKLDEIVYNPELGRYTSMHKNNVAGAMIIIDKCNQYITTAKEIDNSNTSDEFSRMAEEGHSDNLDSDNLARQQYEADNNLPHGSIGEGSIANGKGDSIYEGTTSVENLPEGYLDATPLR